MEWATDMYAWILERGDPRVESWPLMATPFPTAAIFVTYLLVVFAGPRLMKNCQPFSLKSVLVPYNLGLVILSAYMFYEFVATSILSNYSYLCQPVDYSNNTLALRMANVCWWFFISKIIELLDTVFFILRKKNNQVSYLHVYHHCTMIFNWWLGVKYVAGGQSWFHAMLNSGVHVVMYTYYLLTAFGPSIQKYLWWKQYITMLQLTQFMAITIHTVYNIVFTDCDFPQGLNMWVASYMIGITSLFLNFYYQAYIAKRRRLKPSTGVNAHNTNGQPYSNGTGDGLAINGTRASNGTGDGMANKGTRAANGTSDGPANNGTRAANGHMQSIRKR